MTLQNLSAYGFSFQVKVLSGLLTHKEFLQSVHDSVREEYFDNAAHKWIVNQIIKYYDKYNTTPTMEVLKVEMKRVENEVLQLSIKEQLREAYKSTQDDLKYVEEEFSTFCKNQQLKQALLSSVDLLHAGDYDSIRYLVDKALKSGQDKSLGHEYAKDIESRYREDNRIVIPTPWQHINELLQGGIGSGDFGLIFGNPGGGKSWTLVALGGIAAQLGFNVIHYTLELSEDYVGRRYDAFFTGIPVAHILKHRAEVETALEQVTGQIIIKEFATGRASINTVENHIQKCIDNGFKPDLILIDYVDLLTSKKKSKERKDEIDDIYLNTKGLARELKIPIWSVSQVNRSGAKDDIIEGDKAAGSYDKIMITDFAMSLSRKRQDKVNGTGRFHIMKNRYGGDGMTFAAKIDTTTGHIHIDSRELDEDDMDMMAQDSKPDRAGFDNYDKKLLAKKFFELSNQ